MANIKGFAVAVILIFIIGGCIGGENESQNLHTKKKKTEMRSDINKDKSREKATFGAGCFWCVEAIFEELQGVDSVESGYAGGETENPTYEDVSWRNSGHAEVVRITYDPDTITFKELLEVFFLTHDPTSLNKQGADQGEQYRSVIFYHNEKQKELAEKYKKELDESGAYDKPIVTEISPLKNYAKAEYFHQDFYRQSPQHPYCEMVIEPKMKKFRKVFGKKLKRN